MDNHIGHSPDFCIFCAIASGQAPAVVVYEDEHTMAFMDINPATRGHALVIPKKHARDLLDVSEEDALRVMHTVVRVARAIDKALQPDGINLIQANRRAAFQSVYHFHMHVIPRWWDDGLVPIWRHQREDPEVLREVGARIREALSTV
ncbi:MAG: HIT family protein [Anaerolineae bacterium]